MDEDGSTACCGGLTANEWCCITCVSLLLLVAPITILSLTLATHNPNLYVQDLFVPALKTPTSNATKLNTFVFVDLKLRNVMPFNGIRYGGVNVTLYYGGNRSLPVGSYGVVEFYQGMGKTAHKRAVVRTRGLPWEDAFDRVSRGLMVDFTVELAMTVELRRCGAYMEREVVVAAADVSLVGSTGAQVDNKAIRLH